MTWDWGWLVKTPWVLVLVIAEPAVFKILTESEKDLAMSPVRAWPDMFGARSGRWFYSH